jgi:hypothetical protein
MTHSPGSRVLRRTSAVGLVGGWVMSEFPPQEVAAHALSATRVAPAERIARVLAAHWADVVLNKALRDTFGTGYAGLAPPSAGAAEHAARRHAASLAPPPALCRPDE